ncbi:hypothetical protein [Haliea sp. E17]|uniref:hypothetical protein n=1 Tax=Haliea sp. E17 TaxID=3401576 RepID=UPI003AAFEA7D
MRIKTLAALAVGFGLPLAAHANYSTDFSGLTSGQSVDGQDGWTATGAWDEEIVDIGGDLKWRLSNAVTAGSFGDMPFTPAFAPTAGETTATPAAGANIFEAEFSFQSATGAAQNGLAITISPDNGSGARLSYINITDSGSGLDVGFYDYDSTQPTVGPFTNFQFSTLASGLDYSSAHTLRIAIFFAEGPSKNPVDPATSPNDVVMVWVDGALVHTGSTWEQYYPENQPGTPGPYSISQLLFRVSGTAQPALSGGGLLFDDFAVSTQAVADVAAFNALMAPPPAPPAAGSSSDAAPIPTMGVWSLGLTGLSLLGLAGLQQRRRPR